MATPPQIIQHAKQTVDPAIQWNGPQPAPKALWALVSQNLPQTRNDGIYNNRFIAKTKTKSLHAEGRALDIGLLASKPDEKLIGDELFEIFIANAALVGFQEIIWNKEIWSTATPSKHPYMGADPHVGHIHAGFTQSGSQQSVFRRDFVDAIAKLSKAVDDSTKAKKSGL